MPRIAVALVVLLIQPLLIIFGGIVFGALIDGGARVISYVVSGVGFLGAGAIMREGGSIRGLNTAATLWGSAAIGACAGASLMLEAVAATVFVLAANTLLRPVVSYVNRQPVDAQTTEVTTVIHLIATTAQRQAAMMVLEDVLEAEQLPLSELKIDQFGEDEVEIEAALSEASVDELDLDRVVWLVSPQNPLKDARHSAPLGERMASARAHRRLASSGS